MTRQAPAQVAETFAIPSDLSPAAAPALRDALVERMRASADEAALELELGEEAPSPSPCAVQLLVAAARAQRPASRFGPRAAAALETLNRPAPVEPVSA